ncbi:MAG: aminoglycoside phosphotransferase family protein [Bacilli bacterium]|nr:aminoglycoside phosphotransferase family protein [Bacilli bacterium]MDD4643702.1 aminoglycoside phosphotransferase family protein [Bacilli bacterium]
MGKKYKKWRDLTTDPFDIKFKNIKLNQIVSYPPAGNDVVECKCSINGYTDEQSVFIKIERSKIEGFDTEVKHLDILSKNNYYYKMPKVIEYGYVNNKKYIVLQKLEGNRLSDIFVKISDKQLKKEYLIKYGKELAKIHSILDQSFLDAKQRTINDYPKNENHLEMDEYILPYIEYLKLNKPNMEEKVFIHGDFHYANILWKNRNISGVLDFEYSGMGFKEQDIAWACILRPTQYFMDNIDDVLCFLEGYTTIMSFNKESFRWCLINGYCHFYLMNKDNEEYKTKLQRLLLEIKNSEFDY